MSTREHPTHSRDHRPGESAHTASAHTASAPVTPTAGRVLAVLRVATGFIFLWAFLDKTFGLGYATKDQGAWLNGGSPTKGFLGHVSTGPFASMFHGWAGAGWADWLFMLGLGAIGVAVIAGVGLRISAVSGTIMMLLMWAAEWPLATTTSSGQPSGSNNPIVDYHVIYAIALIAAAVTYAGDTWGLGRLWAALPVVRRNPWLR